MTFATVALVATAALVRSQFAWWLQVLPAQALGLGVVAR